MITWHSRLVISIEGISPLGRNVFNSFSDRSITPNHIKCQADG